MYGRLNLDLGHVADGYTTLGEPSICRFRFDAEGVRALVRPAQHAAKLIQLWTQHAEVFGVEACIHWAYLCSLFHAQDCRNLMVSALLVSSWPTTSPLPSSFLAKVHIDDPTCYCLA